MVLKTKAWKEARMKEEFKEALYPLLTAIRSGRSLENAFLLTAGEMEESLFPLLGPKWKKAAGLLEIGYPMEECLFELSRTCKIPEMASFARTVEICKRSEGNVAKVLERTIHILSDKLTMEGELKVLLAKKRLEQRLMGVMPFLILGLLLVSSPGYLTPLFSSPGGLLVLISAAMLMLTGFFLSKRISDIHL